MNTIQTAHTDDNQCYYNPEGLADNILWGIGLAGFINEMNWDRHDLFHGQPATPENIETYRHVLARDWEITDAKTCNETLEFLSAQGGHRAKKQPTNDT